jgi:pimeloyl-ACP methyl ester carboxylesterase
MSADTYRWILFALLLGAVLVTALLWPRLRQGYESLMILLDLVGRPVPTALDFRAEVSRRAITYKIADRQYQADLYQPDGPALAGIVFIPGAAQGGKDDPRVVAFAEMLARSRFAVLAPDVVALRGLKLLPESARDVVDALNYILSREELVPNGRLGVLTTSVGIGPTVLALLDSPISERVRFVVSVGGYFDLPRTLTYLTTGHYTAHGVSMQRAPRDYGKWVYAISNAALLKNGGERKAFTELAFRKLEDPKARVDNLLAALGPEGRKIYDFITNTDPARSRELLDRFSPALHDDIVRLNLAAHDLSAIRSRFILVHGKDDDLIPYGESISMSKALPANQSKVFLMRGLMHVDVTPSVVDSVRLWRAIVAVLSERSR